MAYELADYIKEARQRGMSDDAIRTVLLNTGWEPDEINAALGPARGSAPNTPSVLAAPPPSAEPPGGPPNASPLSLTGGRPRKSKILYISLAVLLVLLLGGGAAFAYVKYFRPLSPQEVFYAAIQNQAKIHSMQYGAHVVLKRNPESLRLVFPQSDGTVSVGVRGSVDLADTKSGAVSLAVTQPLNFGLDIMYLNKTIYAKISGSPKVSSFDLSSLNGKWIKIDAAELTSPTSSLPVGGYLNSSSTASVRSITPQQKDKIRSAILNSGAFTISKTLEDEDVNGLSYHYEYTINKEKLANLYGQIQDILGAQNKDKDLAAFQKGLNSAEFKRGELWVGKRDLLFHKDILELTENASGTSSESSVKLELEQSHFNEPLNLTAPPDTIPFKQAFELILGQLFNPQISGHSVPARTKNKVLRLK